LVDVRTNPITEITPTGLQTTAGHFELDVLVLATGFDEVTGSLTWMNITGIGGTDLRERWTDGPSNFLGFMVAGFPNLFMIHGPGSPGVLAQMITGGEWQVDWVTSVIEDLDRSGVAQIDATPEAEQGWAAEMEE